MNRRYVLDAAEDHLTKATLGITGWYRPRVHIDGGVRHLDVGSSYPGAGEGPKGLAVRQLKRYASWVQTVKGSMEQGARNKEQVEYGFYLSHVPCPMYLLTFHILNPQRFLLTTSCVLPEYGGAWDITAVVCSDAYEQS